MPTGRKQCSSDPTIPRRFMPLPFCAQSFQGTFQGTWIRCWRTHTWNVTWRSQRLLANCGASSSVHTSRMRCGKGFVTVSRLALALELSKNAFTWALRQEISKSAPNCRQTSLTWKTFGNPGNLMKPLKLKPNKRSRRLWRIAWNCNPLTATCETWICQKSSGTLRFVNRGSWLRCLAFSIFPSQPLDRMQNSQSFVSVFKDVFLASSFDWTDRHSEHLLTVCVCTKASIDNGHSL